MNNLKLRPNSEISDFDIEFASGIFRMRKIIALQDPEEFEHFSVSNSQICIAFQSNTPTTMPYDIFAKVVSRLMEVEVYDDITGRSEKLFPATLCCIPAIETSIVTFETEPKVRIISSSQDGSLPTFMFVE